MSVYYNENDPFCAQWLKNLIGAGLIAPGDVDSRSIVDVQPSDLSGYDQCHFFAGIGIWSYALRCAGWPDDRSVWTGSCPCQPFSAAGKRKGMKDERHLWPNWFNLIRECRPGVIFGEQVASKSGLAWLDLIQTDLEGEDYACGAVDTCAAGVGAPHLRQRLYFVADACCKRRQQINQGSFGDEEANGQTRWNKCESYCNYFSRGGSKVGPMADAQSERRDGSEDSSESTGRGGPQDGGVLGDTNNERPQGWELPEAIERRDGSGEQSFGQAGFVNGFWRDAEWILCTDGKARSTEPGTFPLAYGSPARVGRLRAYGNAIVAPQAKEFIKAYMEIEGKILGDKTW